MILRIFIFLTIIQALAAAAQPQPNPDIINKVMEAVDNDDTNTLQSLYAADTNSFSDDFFGPRTMQHYPILQAAADGHTAIVALLLKYGCDPNVAGDTRNSAGMQTTALDLAAQSSHPEICKLLLEAGANPNHHGMQGDNSLHFAYQDAYRPSTNLDEIIGLLLDYGADPFAPAGYNQQTPLELEMTKHGGKLVGRMLGQDEKHPFAVKAIKKPRHLPRPDPIPAERADLLAKRGADFLTAAAQRGEFEALSALFQAGVKLSDAATNCPAVLQTCAVAANEAAKSLPGVQKQIQQTQKQLPPPDPGINPGFVASIQSQISQLNAQAESLSPERWQKTMALLRKNGADYDAFSATALDDTNQAQHLVTADKSMAQLRDCRGRTVLHWSVQTDHPDMLAFWLSAGAPIDATNEASQTALHLAATAGKVDFIKSLLAAGAATTIRDTNGWTALDAAIHADQSDAIHVLLPQQPVAAHPERGIAIPLHQAAASGNVSALAATLDTETNLEARNELGLTPLQVAVVKGHLAAAALLVDKGANLKVTDPDGNSLLHLIFMNRYTVYDRPPTNWLQQLPDGPFKTDCFTNLNVGQYEQGPNPLIQGTCFLLACGLKANTANHAGETVLQWLTADDNNSPVARGNFFFDNDRNYLLALLSRGGGNLEQRDADGNTALHRSVTDVDSEAVDRLTSILAAGADINATNNAGQTPLHVAATKIYGWSENDPPTAPFPLLVYYKPNVNARDNQGRTPMHVLAAADTSFKEEAMRLLLKAGADPNSQDSHGRTAAHLLLAQPWPWEGAGPCLRVLLAAGANLSMKDDQGKTPLHYLASLGSEKPLFFIRDVDQAFIDAKVDFSARDNNGNTPAIIAVKTGTSDVLDWLLKQGADLDATNNQGESARILMAHHSNPFPGMGRPNAETDIFQAAREDNEAAAGRLLNADPSLVNQTNQFQETPLRTAVRFGHTNMVDFLTSHGAAWDPGSALFLHRSEILQNLLHQDPASANSILDRRSLLHVAAANGDLASLQVLLTAGAKVNAMDAWGISPLGYSLIRANEAVRQALLAHGAEENLFDAIYANDTKAISSMLNREKSLLNATNGEGVSAVDVAAAIGRLQILQEFHDHGIDFSSPDYQPLHLAAYYNQTNVVEYLLRKGVDVGQTNAFGFTALHLAACRGSVEAMACLLRHKADLNSATANLLPFGMFARPMAASFAPDFNRGESFGQTPLGLAAIVGATNSIAFLIKSGADVNASNRGGMTPLDLASFSPRTHDMAFKISLEIATDLLMPLDNNPILGIRFAGFANRGAVAAMLQAAGGKHNRTGFTQHPF